MKWKFWKRKDQKPEPCYPDKHCDRDNLVRLAAGFMECAKCQRTYWTPEDWT